VSVYTVEIVRDSNLNIANEMLQETNQQWMWVKKRWNEENISEDESKQTKSLSQRWTSQQTKIRRIRISKVCVTDTQINSFQLKVNVTLTSHTRTEHNEKKIFSNTWNIRCKTIFVPMMKYFTKMQKLTWGV